MTLCTLQRTAARVEPSQLLAWLHFILLFHIPDLGILLTSATPFSSVGLTILNTPNLNITEGLEKDVLRKAICRPKLLTKRCLTQCYEPMILTTRV